REHVFVRLPEWARDDLESRRRAQLEVIDIGGGDGVERPVLHLEDDQAESGVEHDEVRAALAGPEGGVAPDEGLVGEVAVDGRGDAALAGRIEPREAVAD